MIVPGAHHIRRLDRKVADEAILDLGVFSALVAGGKDGASG